MKAFLTSLVAIAVIAVVAAFVLGSVNESTGDLYKVQMSVRR
jgi:hypothetical protein